MARVTVSNPSTYDIALPHPLYGTLPPGRVRVFDDVSLRLLEESAAFQQALTRGLQLQMGGSGLRDYVVQASLANCSPGGLLAGGVWPETATTRTVTYTTVGGEHVFKIPLGSYFKDAQGETTLSINGNRLYYPMEYQHIHRNFNNGGPTSTTDTCIGFVLDGGPASAGWTVTFTWIERRLLVEPPSLALVTTALSGGVWVPDYSVKWIHSNAATSPNAVQVALPPPGYVAEFWRLTPKVGGERIRVLTAENLKSDGQRYLPYVRGPAVSTANEGLFLQAMFDPRSLGSTWKKFRVCYYHPTTGARSALSPETIVSAKPAPAPHDYDQHNMSGPTRYHLWITR